MRHFDTSTGSYYVVSLIVIFEGCSLYTQKCTSYVIKMESSAMKALFDQSQRNPSQNLELTQEVSI